MTLSFEAKPFQILGKEVPPQQEHRDVKSSLYLPCGESEEAILLEGELNRLCFSAMTKLIRVRIFLPHLNLLLHN